MDICFLAFKVSIFQEKHGQFKRLTRMKKNEGGKVKNLCLIFHVFSLKLVNIFFQTNVIVKYLI